MTTRALAAKKINSANNNGPVGQQFLSEDMYTSQHKKAGDMIKRLHL